MNYTTSTQYATLPNGTDVFYRTAGPAAGPVILLLHGFPSSSNQYRNFIPLLAAAGYRVIAPDLPGFGFTKIPTDLNFEYTFENLTGTVASFLDLLKVKKFVMYVFDYGAPTGFRLALQRPEAIMAIVSQNGNAYEEGLQKFWDPLRALWTAEGSLEKAQLRQMIADSVLTFNETKRQYVDGEPHPEFLDPAAWWLDWALLSRPGNSEIQLNLFESYASNVVLYPRFQEYFRTSQVPLLAVWGKNDIIFPPEGALAFKKDLPLAKIELWDGGHFLVESHTEALSKTVVEFLGENGIKGGV